jgi:hypothetical protein
VRGNHDQVCTDGLGSFDARKARITDHHFLGALSKPRVGEFLIERFLCVFEANLIIDCLDGESLGG